MLKFAYGDKFSAFLFDAVMLYAMSLNETMRMGLDVHNGTVVTHMMKSKVFKGRVRDGRVSRPSCILSTVDYHNIYICTLVVMGITVHCNMYC